jgi:Nucleotidyl transferase AbiEii toxin, Type IV TA system
VDDAADGRYSRAPEVEDLVAVCRALNRAGARYVLIGGFAVILHGFVRATKDIDLLIDPSEANVRAIKEALSSPSSVRAGASTTFTTFGSVSISVVATLAVTRRRAA